MKEKEFKQKIIEQVEFISNPNVHGLKFNKKKFKEVLEEYEKIIKKELIEKVKESKETIKEKTYYKTNNLDFKVGMIQGYEEAILLMDKLNI